MRLLLCSLLLVSLPCVVCLFAVEHDNHFRAVASAARVQVSGSEVVAYLQDNESADGQAAERYDQAEEDDANWAERCKRSSSSSRRIGCCGQT